MTLVRVSDFTGTNCTPGEGETRTFGGMSKEDTNYMADIVFKQLRNDGLTKTETNALFCMELQVRHSKKRLLTLQPQKQPSGAIRRKWKSGALREIKNDCLQQKILEKLVDHHTGCEGNNDPCQ